MNCANRIEIGKHWCFWNSLHGTSVFFVRLDHVLAFLCSLSHFSHFLPLCWAYSTAVHGTSTVYWILLEYMLRRGCWRFWLHCLNKTVQWHVVCCVQLHFVGGFTLTKDGNPSTPLQILWQKGMDLLCLGSKYQGNMIGWLVIFVLMVNVLVPITSQLRDVCVFPERSQERFDELSWEVSGDARPGGIKFVEIRCDAPQL